MPTAWGGGEKKNCIGAAKKKHAMLHFTAKKNGGSCSPPPPKEGEEKRMDSEFQCSAGEGRSAAHSETRKQKREIYQEGREGEGADSARLLDKTYAQFE